MDLRKEKSPQELRFAVQMGLWKVGEINAAIGDDKNSTLTQKNKI